MNNKFNGVYVQESFDVKKNIVLTVKHIKTIFFILFKLNKTSLRSEPGLKCPMFTVFIQMYHRGLLKLEYHLLFSPPNKPPTRSSFLYFLESMKKFSTNMEFISIQ